MNHEVEPLKATLWLLKIFLQPLQPWVVENSAGALVERMKRGREDRRELKRQTCLEDSSHPETYTVSLPMSLYLDGTVSTVADLSSRATAA